MVLSDKAVLRAIEEGRVVIHPFQRENLSTSSYDVTLGRWFFRESTPGPGQGIFNPYSQRMVQRVWGAQTPQRAERCGEWLARNQVFAGLLENIGSEDEIIWIGPGETILAHTNEFIGGKADVTTMMKARSSMGRNFIEVCKCAGWGDVGYVNRWTMEITNNSRHYSIPLVVGRRIAQIVFFETEGTLEDRRYQDTGKYQSLSCLQELMKNWNPIDMLPKMYLDREVVRRDGKPEPSSEQE